MNAAETIAAAIQKLAGLDSASTRGHWTAAAGFDDERNLQYSLVAQVGFEFFDVLDAVNEDTHMASADADLVEVLHRTIDAQLAILRDAMKSLTNPAYMAEFEEFVESTFRHPLLLARGILGEVS